MRFLVFGDNGFIGGELKSALIKAGHDVVGLDLWIFSDKYRKHIPFDQFGKVDGVFHCGAISNTLTSDIDKTLRLNTYFTANLAEYCENNRIPLVYSSSAAVYGNSYPDIQPLNLYGWSKYLGERYVTDAGGIALRYFNVFGVTEYKKMKMASVATQAFLYYIRTGRPFELFPGRPRRDFIHVSDVVNANLRALEILQAIKDDDRADYLFFDKFQYDVGSAETMTFEEVLDIMEVPYIHTTSDKIPLSYQYETKARKDQWLPRWKPALSPQQQFANHRQDLIQLTSNQ